MPASSPSIYSDWLRMFQEGEKSISPRYFSVRSDSRIFPFIQTSPAITSLHAVLFLYLWIPGYHAAGIFWWRKRQPGRLKRIYRTGKAVGFPVVWIHPRHYEGTEYQKVTRSSLAALFILPSKLPDMPNPYTGEKPGIVPDKVLIPRCTQNLSQILFVNFYPLAYSWESGYTISKKVRISHFKTPIPICPKARGKHRKELIFCLLNFARRRKSQFQKKSL